MVRSTIFDDQHDSFVNGKIFYGVNSFASSFSTKEHSRAHRGFKEGEKKVHSIIQSLNIFVYQYSDELIKF